MKQKIRNVLKIFIWHLCGKNEQRYKRFVGIKSSIKNFIHKRDYDKACKQGNIIDLDIRELFLSNAEEGSFERLDTVVRFLTIKKFYENVPDAFSLYQKMQEERLGNKDEAKRWCIRFEKLIKSFDERGYSKDSCLTIGKDLQIHDGSHRTALCLYNKIFVVPCNVIAYKKKVEYGLNWFLEHHFTSDEMMEIINQYNQLLQEFKKPYYVQTYNKDDISNDILDIVAEKISENSKMSLYSFTPHSYKYNLINKKLVNSECERLFDILNIRMKGIILNVCKNYEENDILKEIM